DSATDRRLHAVRDQAQGCESELDILLGSVDHPGKDVRSVAPAGLGRRLHHLGAHRGRERTVAPQGWEILRDRREFAFSGTLGLWAQPANPKENGGRKKKRKGALSGREDARRRDGRTGAGSRPKRRGLARRCRKNPRRNGERKGRHAGPAWRSHRME